METKPNDCAFPASSNIDTDAGLTKREYFASQAMASLIESNFTPLGYQNGDINSLAKEAVIAADALIKALNTNK